LQAIHTGSTDISLLGAGRSQVQILSPRLEGPVLQVVTQTTADPGLQMSHRVTETWMGKQVRTLVDLLRRGLSAAGGRP
jgi:hypothetical protein